MNLSKVAASVALLISCAGGSAQGQSLEGIELYRRGASALEDGRLEEAAALLEESYERSSWELRSQAAFLWGTAVFQQAVSILRDNTGGDFRRHREGVEALEQAQEILRRSRDSRSAPLVEQIRQYLEETKGPTIAMRLPM